MASGLSPLPSVVSDEFSSSAEPPPFAAPPIDGAVDFPVAPNKNNFPLTAQSAILSSGPESTEKMTEIPPNKPLVRCSSSSSDSDSSESAGSANSLAQATRGRPGRKPAKGEKVKNNKEKKKSQKGKKSSEEILFDRPGDFPRGKLALQEIPRLFDSAFVAQRADLIAAFRAVAAATEQSLQSSAQECRMAPLERPSSSLKSQPPASLRDKKPLSASLLGLSDKPLQPAIPGNRRKQIFFKLKSPQPPSDFLLFFRQRLVKRQLVDKAEARKRKKAKVWLAAEGKDERTKIAEDEEKPTSRQEAPRSEEKLDSAVEGLAASEAEEILAEAPESPVLSPAEKAAAERALLSSRLSSLTALVKSRQAEKAALFEALKWVLNEEKRKSAEKEKENEETEEHEEAEQENEQPEQGEAEALEGDDDRDGEIPEPLASSKAGDSSKPLQSPSSDLRASEEKREKPNFPQAREFQLNPYGRMNMGNRMRMSGNSHNRQENQQKLSANQQQQILSPARHAAFHHGSFGSPNPPAHRAPSSASFSSPAFPPSPAYRGDDHREGRFQRPFGHRNNTRTEGSGRFSPPGGSPVRPLSPPYATGAPLSPKRSSTAPAAPRSPNLVSSWPGRASGGGGNFQHSASPPAAAPSPYGRHHQSQPHSHYPPHSHYLPPPPHSHYSSQPPPPPYPPPFAGLPHGHSQYGHAGQNHSHSHYPHPPRGYPPLAGGVPQRLPGGLSSSSSSSSAWPPGDSQNFENSKPRGREDYRRR